MRLLKQSCSCRRTIGDLLTWLKTTAIFFRLANHKPPFKPLLLATDPFIGTSVPKDIRKMNSCRVSTFKRFSPVDLFYKEE